jgi:HK97 family phage major capsid protein
MNKLAKLRQRLAAFKADGAKILDAVEADGREMTDAEVTAFGDIESGIDATNVEITEVEAMNERRRKVGAISGSPALSTQVHDLNPATTGGFNDIAEFALAIRGASTSGNIADSRLLDIKAAPSNEHKGGASSGEGYLVPTDFRDEVFNVINETEDLMSTVDVEPTNSRQVTSLADETTPWGSVGISASWRVEGTQMDASKLSQEPRVTPLHELYAFVLATEELLEDAPRLATRLTQKAGLAMAFAISDAIVYGDGVGKPLGWFASDALISIAKEGSQAADTIVAANVLKMYSRLMMVPGDSPYWLTNSDTMPQMATMVIGTQPIWTPPTTGLTLAPGGFLLGLPVRHSEHAKTLGDKGDIQLVSPKGYFAARRTTGVQAASSMHLFFDYAVQAFRWQFRFGGQPHLSAPVTPNNGATKSHFVTLDERA